MLMKRLTRTLKKAEPDLDSAFRIPSFLKINELPAMNELYSFHSLPGSSGKFLVVS